MVRRVAVCGCLHAADGDGVGPNSAKLCLPSVASSVTKANAFFGTVGTVGTAYRDGRNFVAAVRVGARRHRRAARRGVPVQRSGAGSGMAPVSLTQVVRSVAQLVEHRSPKPGAGGSSPSTPAILCSESRAVPSSVSALSGQGFPSIPKRCPRNAECKTRR